MVSKEELAEREKRKARRHELRAQKLKVKQEREAMLLAIGKDAINGIFRSESVFASLLAALLGAGASTPYALWHGPPEGYRKGNGVTAEFYARWHFESMSQKILSQTSFNGKFLGAEFGGGLKTMTGEFDTVWQGPDPDAPGLTWEQHNQAMQTAWMIGAGYAKMHLMLGGAMAGFMGYHTIRILGGILGGMLKQDLIPTP